MQKILIISALVFVLGSTNCQVLHTTLTKAIHDSVINAVIEGTGHHYGDCVEITVQNKSASLVSISVPPGLKLISEDSFLQNMYTTSMTKLQLKAKENKSFYIYAMCCQISKCTPIKGHYFMTGRMATGTLLRLISEIEKSNNQNPAGQAALWALTDYSTNKILRQKKGQNNIDATAIELLGKAGAEGFENDSKQEILNKPKEAFNLSSLNEVANNAIISSDLYSLAAQQIDPEPMKFEDIFTHVGQILKYLF